MTTWIDYLTLCLLTLGVTVAIKHIIFAPTILFTGVVLFSLLAYVSCLYVILEVLKEIFHV